MLVGPGQSLVCVEQFPSLKLRPKYFNAMIFSLILVGLSSVPLTKLHFQKLNVVQRRWVVVNKDDWRVTMKRMNDRLQSAMSFRRQFRYSWHLVNSSEGWPGRSTM